MSNPQLAASSTISPEDDIPRTFRREREAREKEAREREAQQRSAPAPQSASHLSTGLAVPISSDAQARYDSAEPVPAVVKALDISFVKLAVFLMKAVLAGIPALLLLTAILWLFGQALTAFFPQLIKMKILITFPG